MAASTRKILVLLDSTVPHQAAVLEAARLAQREAACLEFYDYGADPPIPRGWLEPDDAAENYHALLRERRIGHLEHLARPLRACGIEVTVCVERLMPLDETIASHLAQATPDLILIDEAPLETVTLWRTELDGALRRHARCPVQQVDAR